MIQSGNIKNFLTAKGDGSVSDYVAYFGMTEQMKRIQYGLGTYPVGMVLLGNNGRSYFTDRSYWPGQAGRLAESAVSAETLREPQRLMYHYLNIHKRLNRYAGSLHRRL